MVPTVSICHPSEAGASFLNRRSKSAQQMPCNCRALWQASAGPDSCALAGSHHRRQMQGRVWLHALANGVLHGPDEGISSSSGVLHSTLQPCRHQRWRANKQSAPSQHMHNRSNYASLPKTQAVLMHSLSCLAFKCWKRQSTLAI